MEKDNKTPTTREERFKVTCPHCGSKDTGFINMGGACCGWYCRGCGKTFN